MSHHKKIEKDMTIADVLRNNPKTAAVFTRHGMHCLGCVAAKGETVGQAAMVHGIDTDKLLAELNEA